MTGRQQNWLLLVVAVLVTLLALEGVLRLSGIARKTARFMCFDAVIGKVYCNSVEGTFTRGPYSNHLAVSPAGMVDRDYPMAKPEDALRIVLLGDSFTASEYLPTADKFEGLLEQSLSQALDRQVEILNFGISATETWNHLQIFHLRSVHYHPDLTLLAFFWGNDVRDNIGQLRDHNPNPLLEEYKASPAAMIRELRANANRSLWNHSLLYQVVHDGYGNLERLIKYHLAPVYFRELDRLMLAGDMQGASPQEKPDAGRIAGDTDYDDDDLFFWDSAGWRLTRKLLLKLRDETQAAGSRLVVLHFPSEALVRSAIPLPHKRFDTFLERNDITGVSLFGDYYAMEPGELHRHFIPDDGHWTRYGHRYVAGRLHDRLFDALAGR